MPRSHSIERRHTPLARPPTIRRGHARTAGDVETYRVTMAAGFEIVARGAIESDVDAVTVTTEESGSITLRGSSRVATALADLPYLSMALLELARSDDRSIDGAVVSFAAHLRSRAVPRDLDPRAGFRIRVSDAGSLVRVGPRPRAALQDAIARWCGARPSPRGGGLEFWVIRRRGDRCVSLSLRLDRGPGEKVEGGALKPDLAAMLVRTVPVRRSDVFFDPFAGSGAIPKARARYPSTALFASDVAAESVDRLTRLRKRGELGLNAHVARLDVAATSRVAAFLGGSAIDTVVTDPPWGVFAGDLMEIEPLYRRACSTLRAIVAPGGRVVMLTAATDAAHSALSASAFTVTDMFGVLVNGRKANVVVAHA